MHCGAVFATYVTLEMLQILVVRVQLRLQLQKPIGIVITQTEILIKYIRYERPAVLEPDVYVELLCTVVEIKQLDIETD